MLAHQEIKNNELGGHSTSAYFKVLNFWILIFPPH